MSTGQGELATPAGVENRLRDLDDQMAAVLHDLAKLRDAEVKAKHAWKAALRRAHLSPDRPKVGAIVDGERVTVALRDAWVNEQAAAKAEAYDLATAHRQAVGDHLHTLGEQLDAVRSIGASVRQQWENSGRRP